MYYYADFRFVMTNKITFIIAMIIQIMSQMCSATGESTLTLTAYIGDKIFIPCFAAHNQSVNYWNIQGTLHLTDDLPTEFQMNSTANGLIVYYALPQAAGNYSCYTYEAKTLSKISTVQLVIRIIPQMADRISAQSDLQLNGTSDSITRLSLRATKNAAIYIPCVPALVLGANEVKLWKIDGSLYSVQDLPPYHRMHRGGIICDTSNGSVGSVYQCFSFAKGKSTLKGTYIIEITLFEPKHVTKSAISTPNAANHSLPHHLTAVYSQTVPHPLTVVSKGVYFKEMSTDFQFRIVNNFMTEAEDCTPGDITTSIHSTSTSPNAWLETTKEYAPSFSVPNYVFSEGDAFVNVLSANDSGSVCAILGYQFRVDTNGLIFEHCVPEGSMLCIPLPKDLNGHVLIWPSQPQSDEDCACPLFVETPDIRFSDCYCFKQQGTFYDIQILDNHLCWNNLTWETNATKYLIVKDSYYLTPTRLFENQGEIVIQDPDPLPPQINHPFLVKRDVACIQSESNNVLKVRAVIYDATHDIIKNSTDSRQYFCIDLTNFPDECAPFDLQVITFSQCTQSPLSRQSLGESNSSTCECLEKKLNLTMNIDAVESTSFNASFNISCLNLETFDIQQISNLFLLIHCDNCTDRLIHFDVICAEISKKMLVTDLQPNTLHNVSVIWISPPIDVNQTCEIVKKYINTLSDTKSTPTSSTIIGLVVATCLLSTITSVLIIAIICYYWYKKKDNQVFFFIGLE